MSHLFNGFVPMLTQENEEVCLSHSNANDSIQVYWLDNVLCSRYNTHTKQRNGPKHLYSLKLKTSLVFCKECPVL